MSFFDARYTLSQMHLTFRTVFFVPQPVFVQRLHVLLQQSTSNDTSLIKSVSSMADNLW